MNLEHAEDTCAFIRLRPMAVLDRNLMSSPFEFLNTSLFGARSDVGGDLI